MSGNIFINYRRGDQAGFAGRLYDWLGQAFPKNQLFMDVDNVPLGVDFADYLAEQVSKCDAMLVVIGESWLEAKDADGRRRIDQPEDFVGSEIAAALKSGKRVIPVLVGNAQMVREADLPPWLRALTRRNAVRITHERFRSDVEGLVPALRSALESLKPVPVSAAAPISAPEAVSVVEQEPPAPVVAAAAIPAPPEVPSVARNVAERPPAVPSDAPLIPAEPAVRDAPAIPQSTASASVALSVLWLGLLPWVRIISGLFVERATTFQNGLHIATLLFLYLLPVVAYWHHRGWRLPVVAVAIPVIGALVASFQMTVVAPGDQIGVSAAGAVAIGGTLSWWAFNNATNPKPLHRAIALSAIWLALILRTQLSVVDPPINTLLLVLFTLLCGVAFDSIRRFER